MTTRYVIFLPVRNGEPYLASALHSIFAQTLSNWQLVVLENGSTDATLDVLRDNAHAAMLVRSSPPLSIVENWARIASYCVAQDLQDEICTIVGHDDLLQPGFLQALQDLENEFPEASLYQTHFDLVDSSGELIRPSKPIPRIESSLDYLSARCWGLRDSYGTGYAFRARDYIAVGGMPDLPRLLYADDLLFARLAKIRYKVCSSEVACRYRLHGNSTSGGRSLHAYGVLLGAFDEYVSILQLEWPSLGYGDSSALSALIARDAMVFTVWPAFPCFPPTSRQCIARLTSLFERNSRGVPFRRFLGSNFVTQRVYVRVKAAFILLLFLKSRFSQWLALARGDGRKNFVTSE